MARPREVVIGSHSRVWRAAAANPAVNQRFKVAIGHREVPGFPFDSNDRVWVFSYSRFSAENSRMLAVLQEAGVKEVVYISSATTIVAALTRCYEYPRVKRLAEVEARQRLKARILTLGIVYVTPGELPGGENAVTSQASIDAFLLAPLWQEREDGRTLLFEMRSSPFRRAWEAPLQRIYGAVQWMLRRWPCVLRPLDVILRALGIRWYGYVHLSNRLWNSTTS